MFPTLPFFKTELSLYSIMAACGILAAGFWAMRTSKKRLGGDQNMLEMLLCAGIGVFIGGSLVYAVVNIGPVIRVIQVWGGIRGFGDILLLVQLLFGGTVFYGGLLGALAGGFLYLRHKKLSYAAYSDISAPVIPLFHAFGRVGCFLGGCCYGVEWRHGLVFHSSPVASANGVPRFPVQLLEAAFNLCLFFALAALLKRGAYKGRLLAVYLLAYPTARFFLEFLRGDRHRGFVFGVLSTSQFISLLCLLCTSAFLLAAKNRQKQNPQE